MSEFSSFTHSNVIANCAYKKSMENYSLYVKYHTCYLCNNDDYCNTISKYLQLKKFKI